MAKEQLENKSDAMLTDEAKINKIEKSIEDADVLKMAEILKVIKTKKNFFETDLGEAYILELEQKIDKRKKADKYNRMRERILIGVMIAVTCIVTVAAVKYGYEYIHQEYTYKESQDEIEDLKVMLHEGDEAVMESGDVSESESAQRDGHSLIISGEEDKQHSSLIIDEQKPVLKKFEQIYKKNRDFIGWVKIDGTNLDCPVVQTVDNEYYLNHDFKKDTSEIGLPFLDTRNDWKNMSDDNLIIYGHNLKNDNMFGSLRYYLDKSYYLKHKYIEFDTLYAKGRYEIALVCLSKVAHSNEDTFRYYDFLFVNTEEEYNYAVAEMKKEAQYDTGVSIKCGDSLLTLSTCNNYVDNGRLYIVARKITK